MSGHKPWSTLRAKTDADADPIRRAHRETLRREALTILAVAALAEVRKARGLTQTAVAEQMGVTQTRVSAIENGDDLQITTIERYVEALGGHLEVRAVFPDATFDLGGQSNSDQG